MLPRVLVLTDRTQLPRGRELVATLLRCLDAGLEAVVVRELDLPAQERDRIVDRLAQAGVVVISARTWSPGASGVHLSANQPRPDPSATRLHGRSCHDDEELRAAVAEGASYVTVSPVAATATKPGYGPALGDAGLRRAVDLAGSVPVFALGGVDARNAAAMRAAGAHGVAVMGAVMRADDPVAAFERISERVG